ncbi:hypothetical protein Tco_0942357, partial [Tanacetum coccineum]
AFFGPEFPVEQLTKICMFYTATNEAIAKLFIMVNIKERTFSSVTTRPFRDLGRNITNDDKAKALLKNLKMAQVLEGISEMMRHENLCVRLVTDIQNGRKTKPNWTKPEHEIGRA